MEALRLAKILKIRQHVPCSLFRIVVLLEVIAFHLIKPFKSCILILQEKMSILDNLPIWISLGVKCQCPIIAYMFNADCLFPLKYSFCSNSMNSYYYRHDVNDPQLTTFSLNINIYSVRVTTMTSCTIYSANSDVPVFSSGKLRPFWHLYLGILDKH